MLTNIQHSDKGQPNDQLQESVICMSENAVLEKLRQLIQWNALELCRDERALILRIAYVMNDATECFLQFTEATVQGELDETGTEDSEIQVVHNEQRTGLIIRQMDGNTVTIWYTRAEWICHFYQYHMIGHSWRRDKGEEDIRRLVNLICVVHDKWNYLGEVCSETDGNCTKDTSGEVRIAALAEFAPVRFHTPINESILDWYADSYAGVESAICFSKQAGDRELENKLLAYAEAYQKGKITPRKIKSMANLLLEPRHRGFWTCIEKEIETASLQLPVRRYGEAADAEIRRQRELVAEKYRMQNYQGEYPRLQLTDADGSRKTVRFVEEQPFTVMEDPKFRYRIFSMMHTSDHLKCEWTEEASWQFFEVNN